MVDVVSVPFLRVIFLIVFAVIGIGCIVGLCYGIASRRFTDKLVAVNLVTTLSLNAVCMLAVFFKQDYVLDIALIYALLSFAAVVVLAKLLGEKSDKKGAKNK